MPTNGVDIAAAKSRCQASQFIFTTVPSGSLAIPFIVYWLAALLGSRTACGIFSGSDHLWEYLVILIPFFPIEINSNPCGFALFIYQKCDFWNQ